jgi:hypothetical protein
MEVSEAATWLNPGPALGTLGSVSNPEVETSSFTGRVNRMRGAALERAFGSAWRTKTAKGEAHERDRDGTSPAGRGGSKASRG